jgi:hypothetical protein
MLNTVELKNIDAVKNIISDASNKILSTDLTIVPTYVLNENELPVLSDSTENFTKYEWYVIKYQINDGWHIDGQVVVDIAALNNYRSSSINEIDNYAISLGFDINSAEIKNIISAAGISSLTTKTAMDNSVVRAKGAVDALFNELKNSSKTLIQTTINSQNFKDNYVGEANSIRDLANTGIDSASTISIVNSVRDKAITDITNLKALTNITFNASLTTIPGDGDYKYLALGNIASDVIITKVNFIYGTIIEVSDQKYSGNSYLPALTVASRLQELNIYNHHLLEWLLNLH